MSFCGTKTKCGVICGCGPRCTQDCIPSSQLPVDPPVSVTFQDCIEQNEDSNLIFGQDSDDSNESTESNNNLDQEDNEEVDTNNNEDGQTTHMKNVSQQTSFEYTITNRESENAG